MIMHSAAAFVGYALLAALLAGAVLFDLRSRRIPNRLVVAGIGLALALHAVATITGNPALAGRSWWAPLAGFGAGLALLMPLHLLRAMGAGDVKLMAMIGAFLGPLDIVGAGLASLLAGGLLSLCVALVQGSLGRVSGNVKTMVLGSVLRGISGGSARFDAPPAATGQLPYAVAIASGTVAYLLLTRYFGWSLL
jgi:prepilin peptidase CpaA